MNLFSIPWLELTLLIPLGGALWTWLSRDSRSAARLGFVFTALTLVCAMLAWVGHESGASPGGATAWDLLPRLLGHRILHLDELSAPLLPLIALLHFLTVVATTGAKSARFTFSGMLAGEANRLAIFAAAPNQPWLLIALLALSTIQPYVELRQRGKSTHVYVLHMGLFVFLLMIGWAFVEDDLPVHLQPALACIPLLLAVLVRSGTIPAHLWVADLFENSSFGGALLYVTPLAGVYAAVRLVMPVSPDWVLRSIGLLSLATALYAAGLAVVQTRSTAVFCLPVH